MADDDFSHREGFARVRRLFGHASKQIDSETEPAPPPEGLIEWTQYTMLGVFVGMVIGGGKQLLQHYREGAVPPPANAPTHLHAARAVGEAQTRRLAKTLNETIKQGGRFGAISALFFGVQELLAVYRDQRDSKNALAAALVTGGTCGAFIHGSGAYRLKSAAVMAGLGSLVAVPADYVQQQIMRRFHPQLAENRYAPPSSRPLLEVAPRAYPERPYDVADAVIAQLTQHIHQQPPGAPNPQVEATTDDTAPPDTESDSPHPQWQPTRRWWILR